MGSTPRPGLHGSYRTKSIPLICRRPDHDFVEDRRRVPPVLTGHSHFALETMRDIFTDIFDNQPLDPMEAARRNARPNLRKRFYKDAAAGEASEGGHPVLLDGRPVRTPARRLLAAPQRALAEALVAEWNAQGNVVDPARMPLTRLANAVIDAVADRPQPVADEIAKYLGSDLLFYRADAPAVLVAKQSEAWDPVLAWARDVLGARFVQIEGVIYAAQPEQAVAAARAAIPQNVWCLGAVSLVTSLTGS